MASFWLPRRLECPRALPSPRRCKSSDYSPFLFFCWHSPSCSCGWTNPMHGFWHCCSVRLPPPPHFSIHWPSLLPFAHLRLLFAQCLRECWLRFSIFFSRFSRCDRIWIGASRG